MSRKTRKPIRTVIVYRGSVTCLGEFHSGALESCPATDHPLVRTTGGKVVFRGESFAGLLRKELVRYFGYKCKDYQGQATGKNSPCNCKTCSLMGHSLVSETEGGNKALDYHSSRLRITGGVFSEAESRIRHGVAIERRFQTAALHRKHDLEALTPGASAPLRIEIENPHEHETTAVEQILTEIDRGFISLGGKKGAGFGRAAIECSRHLFDLSTIEGVRDYLLGRDGDGEPIKGEVVCGAKEFLDCLASMGDDYHGCRLMVPFDILFPELFLVNDPMEAALVGSDHVAVVDSSGEPWLPPATIRGVFRSRGEQILRTLNPKGACDASRDEAKSGSSLKPCSSRINALKGERGRNWPSVDDIEGEHLFCLGCQLFGSTLRTGRVRFLPGVYGKNWNHDRVLQHFLAIDRFTGGGKDGAKFDVWACHDITFKDCRVVLEDFKKWQIGLLALIFKDLVQADLRMGFGTRKGYGQAVGRFNSDQKVSLAAGRRICECRIEELQRLGIEPVLEETVEEFRKTTGEFKGAIHGA
jgi:CRISPR/Cas system CSM-associated protein Csm3 (group 7 of RAMP superfamily)